ncbi:DUF6198 family protein [Mycoplasmatota bacterium WC44]
MRNIKYLIISVLFNAFGTAMMANSELGLSAWGAGATNIANYYSLSLGAAFNIIAVLSYIVAIIILRRFNLKEAVMSFVFAFSFGFFVDLFMYMLPDFGLSSLLIRVIVNIVGLSVMSFGIAVHLRINLAVHPMDVYLGAVQKAFKSIAIGTYFVYGTVFIVALIYGYLYGDIQGIGIGTINTILFAGLILKYYDKVLKYI